MIRFLVSVLMPFALGMLVHAQVATGHLSLKLVIIDELSPKPVILTKICLKRPNFPDINLRTDADGKINVDLDPGTYSMSTGSSVLFKGKQFAWVKSIEIKQGSVTELTLTQEDATVSDAAVQRSMADAATYYRRYKRGIVTVENDTGQGSGFLIDSRGLILTNYHVAGGSLHLAVKVEKGETFRATLLAGDEKSDVAIIQISPEVAKQMIVLPLLPIGQALGTEGERVAAIGNPLNQEKILTDGIISKVESDVIITDVNINHGNSGGPLINMAGEVLGITTFGDVSSEGGPGISGVVSIRKADSAIQSAISKYREGVSPSAEKLPEASTVSIPTDMLRNIAGKLPIVVPHLKQPRNFRTYVETPFNVMAKQVRFENEMAKKVARRYKKSGGNAEARAEKSPDYFWRKYVGDIQQPVVTLNVMPWPQEESGSAFGSILGSIAGVRTHHSFELRDDFREMTLLRDGVPQIPIRQLRIRDPLVYEDELLSIKDIAYGGIYLYDPTAFTPGAKIEIQVWKNDSPDAVKYTFDRRLQESIWKQFEQWNRMRSVSQG